MSDYQTHPTPADNATRRSGSVLGIVVFLVGIVLLGYVFATARALFDAPPPPIPTTAAAPAATTTPAPATTAGTASASAPTAADSNAAPSAALVIGQSLTQFVQKLFVLLLMCIAGSLIASKGIDLFVKTLPHATNQ